jgi:hypothetical protein
MQVFTTLSHPSQCYDPDGVFLRAEDRALKLLFAGPGGSIQSQASC